MAVTFKCFPFRKPTSDRLHLSEVDSDLTATNLYLQQREKPITPVVGEFHFARYPHEQWDDEIKKMKAGGITIVSTYLMWIYHEEVEGEFDFTGDKNLRHFLEICEQNQMLVLLRIGPWSHGEVIYGGFPEYIQNRDDKRTSSPEFLKKVRLLFRAYYEQSKDFFYQNNSVVIGIQVENEYGGKDRAYIPALRRMAIEEGFRLPLYTITAWPPNGSLKGDLLPMFGRYLERPWTQHIDPLPTDNRFRICNERIDKGIGSDILKDVSWDELPYDDFPYATCELGLGVQVCEHRRPIISRQDAYSLGIIQLAQGVNLLGYYMYHGCRNPLGRYQESVSSGYPNNCPISSYDFQGAISEYGYTRDCYHSLKLLHLFMADYQEDLANAQPFFCKDTNSELDYKISVRMHKDGHGYLFVNTHQRLEEFSPIDNVSVVIHTPEEKRSFPNLTIPSGISAFFPIEQSYGPVTISYMTAQPICYDEKNGVARYFFFVPDGITCRGVLHGPSDLPKGEIELTPNRGDTPIYSCIADGKISEYYLLTEECAYHIYKLAGKVFFCSDTVICLDGNHCIADYMIPNKKDDRIMLEEIPHTPKSGDDYLFSKNPPKEYRLHLPKDLFDQYDDWKITFGLIGNVAQLYCNDVMMADWFNYNQTWEVGLKRFRRQIETGQDITIVVSGLDLDHAVYFEYPMQRGCIDLTIESMNPIKRIALPLDR